MIAETVTVTGIATATEMTVEIVNVGEEIEVGTKVGKTKTWTEMCP